MTDYRTHGDPRDTTTIHHVEPRSGSNTIYFILGGVVALVAILWFAFSGAPAVDSTPDAPAVAIENNAAPEAAEPVAPMTPDTPAPEAAPAPEVAPAPEATAPDAAAPATPAPAP